MSFLEPVQPFPVVIVSGGERFLPVAVLEILRPIAPIRVVGAAGIRPEPFHEAIIKLAFVGGAGRPQELAPAGRTALLPLPLVHAPVDPEILTYAVGQPASPFAGVEVAVREASFDVLGLLSCLGGGPFAVGGGCAGHRRKDKASTVVVVVLSQEGSLPNLGHDNRGRARLDWGGQRVSFYAEGTERERRMVPFRRKENLCKKQFCGLWGWI